jgi:quercetin dioxygenase-like cupin family protein
LIAAVVITCGIVGVAIATPIVGLVFGNILASGTIGKELLVRARVKLPPVVGATTTENDQWNGMLITDGPTDFIVQDVSYAPGGYTGWHSHPGLLLVSVTEGSIEWYNSKCERTVYNVGDSFTENTRTHFVRNVGSVNGRFMVTYVLAQGQPRRIDQDAPACAADLGLP